MYIRIFSLDPLELLAEIDDYESFIFEDLLYETGEFELTISSKKNNVQYLVEDNIIMRGNDHKKCGIIQNVERSTSDSETLVISGYTMHFLFGFRIAHPGTSDYDSITDSAETCIKHYLDNNIVNPTDSNRAMSILTLATDQGRGSTETFNARYEYLNELLNMIQLKTNLGISITLDSSTGLFEIDVIEGADHSHGTDSPVLFSSGYDNLKDEEYYRSKASFKNHVYVLGEGTGSTREVVEVGTQTGINRREIVLDTNLPLAELSGAGSNILAENQSIETYEGRVIDTGPFEYKVDYDLGDLVTIINTDWEVEVSTRIIGIKEIDEPGNTNIEIQFGSKIPELKDVIKKKTKKEIG